jgi:hypothetical protein
VDFAEKWFIEHLLKLGVQLTSFVIIPVKGILLNNKIEYVGIVLLAVRTFVRAVLNHIKNIVAISVRGYLLVVEIALFGQEDVLKKNVLFAVRYFLRLGHNLNKENVVVISVPINYMQKKCRGKVILIGNKVLENYRGVGSLIINSKNSLEKGINNVVGCVVWKGQKCLALDGVLWCIILIMIKQITNPVI